MRALVVYESVQGHTAKVACAVAAGISAHMPVALVAVHAAPRHVPASVDLLVVGGPTHAFGLSGAGSRSAAAAEALGGSDAQGCGIREWLASMTLDSLPVYTAAFDTRNADRRLPGSAAAAAHRRLVRAGAQPLTPPESFRIDGRSGPVPEEELDRAEHWGEDLTRLLSTAARTAVAG